jgi:hypothetical protein
MIRFFPALKITLSCVAGIAIRGCGSGGGGEGSGKSGEGDGWQWQ